MSMSERVYQCSDGHLWVSDSWLKLQFTSAHFGSSKFGRCPVDGRWRMSARLDRDDLTDAQLAQAQQHRY
jgi:hypothetical protein